MKDLVIEHEDALAAQADTLTPEEESELLELLRRHAVATETIRRWRVVCREAKQQPPPVQPLRRVVRRIRDVGDDGHAYVGLHRDP